MMFNIDTVQIHAKETKEINADSSWENPNFPDMGFYADLFCRWSDEAQRGEVEIRVGSCFSDDDVMCKFIVEDTILDLEGSYQWAKSNIYDMIPDNVSHEWFEKWGFVRW